jgi:hypothetical protein
MAVKRGVLAGARARMAAAPEGAVVAGGAFRGWGEVIACRFARKKFPMTAREEHVRVGFSVIAAIPLPFDEIDQTNSFHDIGAVPHSM